MSKQSTNQPPPERAKQPCSPLAAKTTSEALLESNAGLPADIPRMPSSLLEKEGWDRLMREVTLRGAMIVTHGDKPEAVVLSTDTYETLARMAEREQARKAQQLAKLNERLDEKLACLRSPNARQALDAFMNEPAK